MREPRKNLARLVDAFGLLHETHTDTALVLAGPSGPDDPTIDAAIGRLSRPAAECVLVTDWLDDDQRDAVLAAASVVAYPSLDEGFGFPALEGMAAGVPVVAARAGAIPEVVGEAAVLVDPLEPADIADGLARALDDDALRADLVAGGRAQLGRYTWSAMADGMASLYRDALEGGDRVITVVAGGVGAARYLRGLVQVVEPSSVTAIVNTGDDTELHGLTICPDLDTVTYTLGGAIDPERGWGLSGETWRAMEALGRFVAVRPDGSGAAATWFNLGDADLATHLYRTHRRREGATLSEVTAEISAAFGVPVRLLPMSDDRVETRVAVEGEGEIGFQEYFVGRHHDVAITGVRFDGVEQARPAPGVARRPGGRRRRGHRPVEPDRLDRPGRGGARRPSGRSRPGGRASSRCRPSSAARR